MADASPDAALDTVWRRTQRATWAILAVAAIATTGLAASASVLAVIPPAFVLGWLNLAGL